MYDIIRTHYAQYRTNIAIKIELSSKFQTRKDRIQLK